MKKHLLVTLPSLALLGACAHAPDAADTPAVGMANPASVYCVEQGGELEIVRDADGNERGMCHLPDGSVHDEWELYRAANGQ